MRKPFYLFLFTSIWCNAIKNRIKNKREKTGFLREKNVLRIFPADCADDADKKSKIAGMDENEISYLINKKGDF